MTGESLRVGALARRTGISVRTLHYYDEIRLLSPSMRTEAGHRLYSSADVARLQQIRSLQQLGFSLEQVRACLEDPRFSLRGVLALHIGALREQAARLEEVRSRLEGLARYLGEGRPVSVEEFLTTLEVMSRMERYYTQEQLAWLKQRGEQVGEARIREVEAEWPRLIAEVRAEMEAGADPTSERVQELTRRWQALVLEFTGGNPEIAATVRRMYENEPEVRERAGIDPGLFEYVNRAIASGAGG